ncbi:glycoside hydrolase family 15 protein [Pseudarthrobacter sp. NIBRBAC000502772]|uniref:glycoside hydrolase family 15 protein n=1 Tax=Pseudarthrobacter sp. NIBRBAC000502772 TaxID=2590775 RepID=UPI0011328F21|nr:glycoside hydrolase family 15 protein [Pseudarthrobacter sp. NIBRBAC000502772]QDG66782.1 glycoside hydrolase family 15 protein [Pseudarthrobacter sp. NIBRBAC000502772]
MAALIEDYALLSDLHTGPLVSRRGSVDWLCFPRFDSPAVFAALLGGEEHGRWLLAPSAPEAVVIDRHYVDSTFVLQTTWQTDAGKVLVTDFMPVGDNRSRLVRRMTGLSGTVLMRHEIRIRPQYATVLPWVSRVRDSAPGQGAEILLAMSGPDALALRGEDLPIAEGHRHAGEIWVAQGKNVDFELTWFPSHEDVPSAVNVDAALELAVAYWTTWAGNCRDDGKYGSAVKRSLLVLRALTHYETGGIVAAPTTSLPEDFGGSRNWDYRYCWLRDASLTLEAMLTHGYESEALKWRNWLLRALAGDPEDLQIMYGVGGERDLTEKELPHLPGYQNSRPVRIGNAAVSQYQADVVGEVMVALERLRLAGGKEDHFSWALQRALLGSVENHLEDKDFGLWEMRGDAQYFTHSRVMMWAAFDSGVRAVRDHGLAGPAEHWKQLREGLAAEIMDLGFNRDLNSFTQTYGGRQTDAALLALPQVGFLAYDDERMLGTVDQLEKELLTAEGLLMRYRTETGVDGLEPGEHAFLACSFWLVEQYARSGRWADARNLMDVLAGLANELGLLSEEYSMKEKRMAGNFPQAFSHLTLVRAADAMHGVDRLSLHPKH